MEVDDEVCRVQALLRDTAALHTLALEVFVAQTSNDYLETDEQLRSAFNLLCHKIDAPSLSLTDDDAEDLFDSKINFAAFFTLTQDYLTAVVRAVTVDIASDDIYVAD